MLSHMFAQILEMSVRGTVVIGAVLLVRLLLKKVPKVYSYALWAVVLFRLLCPVSIPSPIGIVPEFTPISQTYSAEEGNSTVQPQTTFTDTDTIITTYVDRNEQYLQPEVKDAPPIAREANKQDLWMLACRYLWLSGVLALAIYSVFVYLRLRLRLRNAIHLGNRIYLSGKVTSPFVLGLLKPRIYLPTFLVEEERSYILAHEQHHIRRFDHVIKLLGYIALVLHWFNPFVWLAYILFCKDMEMSCDEAVIRKLGPQIRADYAASLLNLATGRKTVSVIPLAFGEGDTKGRVKNMSRWKKPKLWICIAAAVLILAVGTVLVTDPMDKPNAEDAPEWIPIQMDDMTPEGIFDVIQSWAGWSGEGAVWGGLNADKLQYSNIQRLPIYKFDTRQELDNFMGLTGKFLTMNDSSKGVPSFYGTAARYDEAFFADYTLILVYVPSGNSGRTFRVSSTEINNYTETFVVEIQETASSQVKEPKQSGWFITMGISDSDIAGCTKFDAYLTNTGSQAPQITHIRTEEDFSYYSVEALLPNTDLSRVPDALKAAVEKEWKTHDGLPKMEAMASSHLWGTVNEYAVSWQEAQSKVGLNIPNPLESLSFVQKRDFYALNPPTAIETHIQITVMATEATDRQISQIILRSGYGVEDVRINLYTTVWNTGGIYNTAGGSNESLAEYTKRTAVTGSGKEVLIVRQTGAEHYSTLDAYWLDGNVLYNMSLMADAGEEEKLETVLVKILEEI